MDLLEIKRRRKLLYASIQWFDTGEDGNCIQRSVALVMDWPAAQLAIGRLMRDDGSQYIHAWVTVGDKCYDPATFEQTMSLEGQDSEGFRSERNVVEQWTVERPWVLDFAKRGGLSRWMMSRDTNVYHKLDGVMGEVLLRERGIPFTVTESGSILPA